MDFPPIFYPVLVTSMDVNAWIKRVDCILSFHNLLPQCPPKLDFTYSRCQLHFAEQKTEAQRQERTCSRCHRKCQSGEVG